MTKTLTLAAALLTLGMGAAFADGDVTAQPAQLDRAPIAQQATGPRAQAFAASQDRTVSVYDQFSNAGSPQGGEN